MPLGAALESQHDPRIVVQRRPGTNVVRSAATRRQALSCSEFGKMDRHVFRYRRRARHGRIAQDPCARSALVPASSSGVASQSCAYSTWITRILPSSPDSTISRICRTIG